MHKNLQQPLFILSFLLLSILFIAFGTEHPTSGGMGRTGAPGDGTCLDCHGNPSSSIDGTITVSGIPAMVEPGVSYTVTLTSDITSGTPVAAGFQVVALFESNDNNAGSWANPTGNSSIKSAGGNTYFGHKPKTAFGSNSSLSWTAEWTAPSTAASDNIVFYAVTALVNGSNGNSGDKIRFSTFVTAIEPSFDPLFCTVDVQNEIFCFGDMNGSLEAFPDGGDGNYTYNWSNGGSSKIITNLSSGSYEVAISDGSGNSTTCSFDLFSPDILILTIDATDALCFDSNLGSASPNLTGGNTPYTYLWSTNSTAEFITDLAPGDYSLTVTDNNGCQVDASFTINGPDSPVAINIVNIMNASCEDQTNGSITVLATGGTVPYEYFWPFDNTTDPEIFGIPPGEYTVEVTDANDCLKILAINVGFDNTLSMSVVSIMSAGCVGANTGSATVLADNGEPDYTYAWSNGGTTDTQSGLAAGTYTVTATDANGCTVDIEVVITAEDNEAPSLSQTSFDVVLDDMGNGDFSIDDITAVAMDNCEVESVDATIPTITCDNLNGISLDVTLLDVNNNQAIVPITINVLDNTAPMLTCPTNITTSSCDAINYDTPVATDNCSTMDIVLVSGIASGEVFPVGTTTNTFSVADASGNVATCSFDIIVNADLATNLEVSGVSCFGGDDGSIIADISGGVEPYTISPTAEELMQLSAGEYTVIVQDAAGCSTTTMITISEPAVLEVATMTTEVSCFNYADGTVQFIPTGGTAPYDIHFMNGLDYNNLPAGEYSYELMDANGCQSSGSLEITEPEILIISEHTIVDASNATANDGSISIVISGGVAPFNYNWYEDDALVSTDENLENAGPGPYFCVVTDANGCSFTSLMWLIINASSVVDHKFSSQINIYPNPNNGSFSIDLNANSTEPVNISLINSQGQIVYTNVMKTQGIHHIDLSQNEVGFYFVKIKMKEKVAIKKIFIIK